MSASPIAMHPRSALSRGLVEIEGRGFRVVGSAGTQRRRLALVRTLDAESDALIGAGLALLGAVAEEDAAYARPLRRAHALIARGLELDAREDAPLAEVDGLAGTIAEHGRMINGTVERLATGRGRDVEAEAACIGCGLPGRDCACGPEAAA